LKKYKSGKMEKKSKLKTIVDAFSKGDDLPRGEKWFDDRISACGSCEFNTKNIEEDKLKVQDKVKIATGICTDKEHCTLCGCCVYQKASEKSENCALMNYKVKALSVKGLNNTPENFNKEEFQTKWKSIGVETKGKTDLDVYSTSTSVDTIYLDSDGSNFNIQLKNTSKSLIEFELIISRKAGLKISSVKPTCSCTVPEQEVIDENTVRMLVKLSTSSFTKNAKYERTIVLNYYINERSVNKVKLHLIGKKV